MTDNYRFPLAGTHLRSACKTKCDDMQSEPRPEHARIIKLVNDSVKSDIVGTAFPQEHIGVQFNGASLCTLDVVGWTYRLARGRRFHVRDVVTHWG